MFDGSILYCNITTLSLEKGIFVGIPGADRVDDDVAPQRGGADVGDSEQIRSHPTRLPACLCLAACWRASWMVKKNKKKLKYKNAQIFLPGDLDWARRRRRQK